MNKYLFKVNTKNEQVFVHLEGYDLFLQKW